LSGKFVLFYVLFYFFLLHKVRPASPKTEGMRSCLIGQSPKTTEQLMCKIHTVVRGCYISIYISKAVWYNKLLIYKSGSIAWQDWVSADETLPILLRMLVELQKIRFHRLNWTEFSEPLKQSICFILELPTLSTLEIEKGDFDESFICHAKHLTHLSITGSFVGGKEGGLVPETVGPLKKTRLINLQLRLYGLANFITWLLGPRSPFNVSHIITLDISGTPDGKVINPLLHAIGGSLKLCHLDALMFQYGSGEPT
jgi:hypothetical protein